MEYANSQRMHMVNSVLCIALHLPTIVTVGS